MFRWISCVKEHPHANQDLGFSISYDQCHLQYLALVLMWLLSVCCAYKIAVSGISIPTTQQNSNECVCFPHLSPGIFGQRLEDTVQYEKKFGPRLAPLLVEQCVDFIRERGLDEEGLFRMPGQANLVKELQESFDCGDKPLFDR